MAWIRIGGGGWRKKWTDSGLILKIKSVGFADELEHFCPVFKSLLLPYLLCQVDKVLLHMHYSSQDPFSCPNVKWSGQPRWLH